MKAKTKKYDVQLLTVIYVRSINLSGTIENVFNGNSSLEMIFRNTLIKFVRNPNVIGFKIFASNDKILLLLLVFSLLNSKTKIRISGRCSNSKNILFYYTALPLSDY